MLIIPSKIEIKKHEQIKFVLRNKAACSKEHESNRLEIHQGRRIRKFVLNPGTSGSRNDRNDPSPNNRSKSTVHRKE
jgi:hypothetical protein